MISFCIFVIKYIICIHEGCHGKSRRLLVCTFVELNTTIIFVLVLTFSFCISVGGSLLYILDVKSGNKQTQLCRHGFPDSQKRILSNYKNRHHSHKNSYKLKCHHQSEFHPHKNIGT